MWDTESFNSIIAKTGFRVLDEGSRLAKSTSLKKNFYYYCLPRGDCEVIGYPGGLNGHPKGGDATEANRLSSFGGMGWLVQGGPESRPKEKLPKACVYHTHFRRRVLARLHTTSFKPSAIQPTGGTGSVEGEKLQASCWAAFMRCGDVGFSSLMKESKSCFYGFLLSDWIFFLAWFRFYGSCVVFGFVLIQRNSI